MYINRDIDTDTEVVINKVALQNVLSAARAIYNIMLHSPDLDFPTSSSMYLLNDSIDICHEALGTERGAADGYVRIMGGMTAAQEKNAREFLKQAGLLTEE